LDSFKFFVTRFAVTASATTDTFGMKPNKSIHLVKLHSEDYKNGVANLQTLKSDKDKVVKQIKPTDGIYGTFPKNRLLSINPMQIVIDDSVVITYDFHQ
jgi:hypothetical protein